MNLALSESLLPGIVIGIDPASTRVAMVALSAPPAPPAQSAQASPEPRDGDWIGIRGVNLAGGRKRTPWSPEACEGAASVTQRFVEAVRSKWGEDSEITAVIEWPVVGKGGIRSTMVQAFTSGAIQAVLVREGCRVEMVNVGVWKRDVIGSGSASKEDVAEVLRSRWPAFFTRAAGDQDLCDAAAIALWGAHHLPDERVG